jgi:hypothetical protein
LGALEEVDKYLVADPYNKEMANLKIHLSDLAAMHPRPNIQQVVKYRAGGPGMSAQELLR